jgi:hypothetical protein
MVNDSADRGVRAGAAGALEPNLGAIISADMQITANEKHSFVNTAHLMKISAVIISIGSVNRLPN